MSRPTSPGPLRRLVLACQIHLGRPAWAAAVLVAATIGLLAHWLPQSKAQRDQLQSSDREREELVRALAAQSGSGGSVASITRQPPALAAPLLPPPAQHHEDVGTLLQIARNNGLSWQQADYSMELGGTFGAPASVLHLRLNLPISGSALQVSRFLGAALNALPHASVESLELDSEDAAGPARAARLRMLLLYRGAQP